MLFHIVVVGNMLEITLGIKGIYNGKTLGLFWKLSRNTKIPKTKLLRNQLWNCSQLWPQPRIGSPYRGSTCHNWLRKFDLPQNWQVWIWKYSLDQKLRAFKFFKNPKPRIKGFLTYNQKTLYTQTLRLLQKLRIWPTLVII